MENAAPRFVADVMLGRLTRWLRALGYDTLYDSAYEDAALAELARRENRILLTRDVELARRKNLHVLLIHDDKVQSQLRQVISAFELNNVSAFTRCIECNAELVTISRDIVAVSVPPYILKTQTNFRGCPQCGKIYWRGTHWARMRRVLSEMQNDE